MTAGRCPARQSYRVAIVEGLCQLLVLACLGIFGGVLSGLVGVGSGIIFVLALVYVAGWEIGDATAASFMIIILSSLSSVLRNTSGESPVNWRASGIPCSHGRSGVAYRGGDQPRRARRHREGGLRPGPSLLYLPPPLAGARQEGERGRPAEDPPALVLLAEVAIGALSGLVGVGGAS